MVNRRAADRQIWRGRLRFAQWTRLAAMGCRAGGEKWITKPK